MCYVIYHRLSILLGGLLRSGVAAVRIIDKRTFFDYGSMFSFRGVNYANILYGV